MSSFFNERTAEYVIVPDLQRHLSRRYGWAIPLFFWRSREGNATAKLLNGALRVRVLAVFARRPKCSGVANCVTGRINFELLEYCEHAKAAGIFSFAAFPAVGDLLALSHNPTIFWLALDEAGEFTDFMVQIPDASGAPSVVMGRGPRQLSLDDIFDGIESRSRDYSYEEAMDVIGKLRSLRHGIPTHFFYSMGGYRPVYFLLPPRASC